MARIIQCHSQLIYHPESPTMPPPLAVMDQNSNMKPFIIGPGSHGGRPFNLTLLPGEQRATTFLKLFVSTEYVDMHGIETADEELLPHEDRKLVTITEKAAKGISKWGAWVAAVTVNSPEERLPGPTNPAPVEAPLPISGKYPDVHNHTLDSSEASEHSRQGVFSRLWRHARMLVCYVTCSIGLSR